MSDEQRRALARVAGEGGVDGLEAARKLVELLEREGHVPAHPSKLGALSFDRTGRGFAIGEFLDRYGTKCSIQDSSIATEACFWLGVDDPAPRVLVPGQSWQPVPLPPGTLISSRMHVHVQLARQLHTVIGRFLETGFVAPRNLPRSRRASGGS